MTPTNATAFAPTSTCRATIAAISEHPMLIAVEWHRRPQERRLKPFTSLSALCCGLIEATISASLSWIASLIIMGVIQCATTLSSPHALLAFLQHLKPVTHFLQ